MMLSNRQHQWIDLAVKLAIDSQCRTKHGAVIVRANSVLAVGTNRFRNHFPMPPDQWVKNSPACTVHAEMAALRRVRDASDTTVYVARVSRQGVARLSRPCDRCWLALVRAGVRRVVYTVNPGVQAVEKILLSSVDMTLAGG
jgi:tRNA(Arg) A34 adenosine deaminase TadA